MTTEEMVGAIEDMRLIMGWRDSTPEIEQVRKDLLAKVDSIEARTRAATDLPTLQRVQRDLDQAKLSYYRVLGKLHMAATNRGES